MKDWKKQHGEIIKNCLRYINSKNNHFILKGGTALYLCYNLNRFSEDIDLDSTDKNIEPIIKGFCEKYNYEYRVAKDTETVKRYMINYGNNQKPLKVEISYRQKVIPPEQVVIKNGINVYDIDTLCMMKTNAYIGRDKIRDLYDLSFICSQHFNELSPSSVRITQNALSYKGIEQFDYLIQTQTDELIDKEKLLENFLTMFDNLGLIYNKEKTNDCNISDDCELE